MQIQSGKLYENKTWRYLYPTLKLYGKTLGRHLNSLLKLGIGLGDGNLVFEDKGPCLYILVDTKIYKPGITIEEYREKLSAFLDWVRFQPYYVIDYVYNKLDKREQHMIVLQIPKSCHISVEKFKLGKYSEMYSEEIRLQLFPKVNYTDKTLEEKVNKRILETNAILIKDKVLAPKFLNLINKEFGTNLEMKDILDHELDLPPFIWEEVFNYKQIS